MQCEVTGGPVPGFWDIIKHGGFRFRQVAPLINRTSHAFRNWRHHGFVSVQGRSDIQSVLGLSDEELDNPMDRETALKHAERWRAMMRDPRNAWVTNRIVWTIGLVQVQRATNSTIEMLSEVFELAYETLRKYCRGVRLRINLQSNMEPICRQLGISLKQMDEGLTAHELIRVVERIGPRIEEIRAREIRRPPYNHPYHSHLADAVEELQKIGHRAVANKIKSANNQTLTAATDRTKWQWRNCQSCLRRYQVGSTTTCSDCILERF